MNFKKIACGLRAVVELAKQGRVKHPEIRWMPGLGNIGETRHVKGTCVIGFALLAGHDAAELRRIARHKFVSLYSLIVQDVAKPCGIGECESAHDYCSITTRVYVANDSATSFEEACNAVLNSASIIERS